jgi:predicted DNA-binding transcriptional regulator AlpA
MTQLKSDSLNTCRAESAEYLKKRGVAALLSLSPRTIDAMTARGELPHVRLSKRCTLYPRQAVLDALAARTIGVR